jgi:hypothetical protein
VEKRQLEGKLRELKPNQHRLKYVMVVGPTMRAKQSKKR